MSLSERLRKDMFQSKMSGDILRSDILGMALAALKNAEISSDKEMGEEDGIGVLRKEAKKLQDAYEQYVNSGNDELAKKEKAQLDAINEYLPQLMSEQDIDEFVSEKIGQMENVSMSDMGKIIGSVMADLKGKADGTLVSASVKRFLTK